MSADFWGICPLCYAVNPEAATADRTFREEWEIGLDGNPVGDPDIRMIYNGRCTACGAKASFDTIVTVTQ